MVRSAAKRTFAPLPVVYSLHFFDIRQYPGAVEVRLGRTIETEVREPAFSGDCLYPVHFWFPGWGFWAKVKVHRAVGVLYNVVARRTIRLHARVHEATRFIVVDGEGPKLRHGSIGRDVQCVGLAAVEPISFPVLRRFEIDLPGANGAPHHPN